MTTPMQIDDPNYVKAMSHPVRVRVLAMLQERKASPNELSVWLGVTLGATAYHVRVLNKLGLIELVGESRVRGAVEHHYRAKARPKPTREDWSKASPIAKQATIGAQLKMLEDDTSASASAGGFDREEAVLERKTARLDDKGWATLAAETAKYLKRVEKIETDAAKRIAGAGDDGVTDAVVVVLGYEGGRLADQIPEPPKGKRKPMRRPVRSSGA